MPRRPKSTHTKKLSGTYRADRSNGDDLEPEELEEMPDPPEWMAEDATAIWWEIGPELVEKRVLTTVDLPAFRTLCVHGGLMEEAARKLAEEGVVIDGYRGGKVKHPAAQVHRDNSIQFRQWCSLFGVDPADRPKVPARKRKKPNPFDRLTESWNESDEIRPNTFR